MNKAREEGNSIPSPFQVRFIESNSVGLWQSCIHSLGISTIERKKKVEKEIETQKRVLKGW